MLVLVETAAGYALFKVLNDKLVTASPAQIQEQFSNNSLQSLVSLHAFSKFDDMNEALEAAQTISESAVPESLRKFLKKKIIKAKLPDELVVTDPRLGGAIKDSLKIPCIFDTTVMELIRGIRSQLDVLLGEIGGNNMKAMSLGLSHSLSRFRLKFSAEKVDTMIIQAIALLDDIDKELNIYVMRLREWYGWHFPELGKIIADHGTFISIVSALGPRANIATTDLSFLDESTAESIRTAASVSMGVEVSESDMTRILALCSQVKEMTIYRTQLYDYLKQRMAVVAPNLTMMVGEMVGARLIAHAGSLVSLAKHPASTVQIIGAEKALFRALRGKKDTPKYGLIYHASVVGQAQNKDKGKISRSLAAKTALAVRVDALGDSTEATIAKQGQERIMQRIVELEQQAGFSARKKSNVPVQHKKVVVESKPTYNVASDVLLETTVVDKKDKKKDKKDKKKKTEVVEEPVAEAPVPMEEAVESSQNEEKKEKKKKKKKEGDAEAEESSEKKEKKEKKRRTKEEEGEPKKKKSRSE
ncbi:hypothetical protein RCL1_000493 [Eukaryota sp. TZLM3-RCL]